MRFFEPLTSMTEIFNNSRKCNVMNLVVFISVKYFLKIIGYDFQISVLLLRYYSRNCIACRVSISIFLLFYIEIEKKQQVKNFATSSYKNLQASAVEKSVFCKAKSFFVQFVIVLIMSVSRCGIFRKFSTNLW